MSTELKDETYYIRKISETSDIYGNRLLEMLDEYNVNGLKDLTLEQLKSFYERKIT